VLAISLGVTFEFWNPILPIGRWNSQIRAADVPMPEASMDENDLALIRKNDIRLTRKIFTMQAVPIPHLMQKPPNSALPVAARLTITGGEGPIETTIDLKAGATL